MNRIIEVNCETGEIIERDETPEEIAIREESNRQEAEALANRQSALAKLQALGLTEEEIQSLLG
jgi:DNA-binding transcriptional regulator YhcF (GntR family)